MRGYCHPDGNTWQDDRAWLAPLLRRASQGGRNDRFWSGFFVNLPSARCLLHGLSFLATSNRQHVVWNQAEGKYNQPGDDQGKHEQYQTEEETLHTSVLLSMLSGFATCHLERATLVGEDFCTVPIMENQVRGAIMVKIRKADRHHDLVCTVP